ncbi:MAG: histidine phosphatase family protein [Pseudomonadota bacterium]
MQRRQVLGGLAAAALLHPRSAGAAAELLERLAEPRTHAIMRHALAPGTGDPARFVVDDCSTQRNLDARGRDQAREIGRLLSEAGIVFDDVLSSQWCRCLDTARLLGIGPVREEPSLNSFFRQRDHGPEQTRALKRLLGARPPGETLMLVTHQVNVSALTDRFTTSGEIIVFRLEGETVSVLGDVLLAPA